MTKRSNKPTGERGQYPYDDASPAAVMLNWVTSGGTITLDEARHLVFPYLTDEENADEILYAWKFKTAPTRADLIAAAAALRGSK